MALRPAAYQGNDPYIFISYCHKDSAAVYPIIAALQQQGLRVWYDEGIEVGSHWDQVISQHLLDCSCALCFLTPNFLKSENCLDEVHFAKEERKGPLIVYLEQMTLPVEFRFRYGRLHALSRGQFSNDEAFIQALATAELVRPCQGSIPVVPEKKPAPVSAPVTAPASAPGPAPEDTPPIDAPMSPTPEADALYKQAAEYHKKQNYIDALIYYKRAAQAGHIGAMNMVGFYHSNGNGVRKS